MKRINSTLSFIVTVVITIIIIVPFPLGKVQAALACNSTSECGPGYFCKKEACNATGQCVSRPQICTAQYDPVCGCDGKTYSNSCVAHSHGVNVDYRGECHLQHKITLDLEINGTRVKAWWSADFVPIDGFTLYFAPYPTLSPIGTIPLGSSIYGIEGDLPYGSDYYIAVGAIPQGETETIYSNIEYFRVRHIWRPRPGTSWQWQLTGKVDTEVDAEMFDIDLFENDIDVIYRLHQEGRVVICYFSAGSYEDWRPDKDDFDPSVIGHPLEGWPGEKWLDIRAENIRAIMESRLDLAVEKGCDGVEPDNVDGYQNDTGFALTYEDQIAYNRWLAKEAHKRGLSIGLKNDLDQIRDLEPYFDWALNEECFTYDECDKLLPFIQSGKAVFGVEYDLDTSSFCQTANALGFDFMKKEWDLDAWRKPCRTYD